MSTLALSLMAVLALGMWIFSMLAAFFLGQSAIVQVQYRHREALLTNFGAMWDRLTRKDGENA